MLFHYSQRRTRKILSELNGQSRFPEVRRDELPDNEQAFFLGLSYGNYQIDHLHWSGRKFVLVKTESRNDRTRSLLQKTLGRWGEFRESPWKLRVYLASPQFDFMVEPLVTSKFLDATSRYAPFLLGVLLAKLTDTENRVSLYKNEALLKRLIKIFQDKFGFSMGNFRIESRQSKTVNQNGIHTALHIPIVEIKNPGEVFGALVKVDSVRRLPFLKDVAQIASASK